MIDIQEARRIKREAEGQRKQEDYQYFVNFIEPEIDARIVEAAKKGHSVICFTVSDDEFYNLANLQHFIYDAYHAAGYVVNTCSASRYVEIYIYWSEPAERKEE